MEHLLVALTIMTVTTIALCVGGFVWVRHRFRRTLRVSPSVRSPAPTTWLVSAWEPAQLHRRLRRVGAVARGAASADPRGPVTPLARDIESRAVAAEAHLVLVSRMWRREKEARHSLRAQVTELEHLAARAAAVATSHRHLALASAPGDPLADLRERLDALEAARSELIAIERGAGLAG